MKRFRILLMIAGVLGAASSASAQSLSSASLQAIDNTVQTIERCDQCPAMSQSTWCAQALHHGAMVWQRLRTMATSSKTAGCCEAAKGAGVQVTPQTCADYAKILVRVQDAHTSNLMLGHGVNSNNGMVSGIAISGGGYAPPLCVGIKPFVQMECPLGYTSGKPAAPCCCAKACTCCEVCKAKAAPNANFPVPPPAVARTPATPSVTWTLPVPPPPQMYRTHDMFDVYYPPVASPRFAAQPPSSPTQYAVPPMSSGQYYIQPTPAPAPVPMPRKLAKLVTPDFEAHCESMTHSGNHVILEGNVMLLCKKHAHQPVRIEAQRVVVNLVDGSWRTDTNATAPVIYRSEWRSSAVAPTTVPAMPVDRIIQIVPVPAAR